MIESDQTQSSEWQGAPIFNLCMEEGLLAGDTQHGRVLKGASANILFYFQSLRVETLSIMVSDHEYIQLQN